MPSRPHVLIAGGGVAAVEALLALHHLAGNRLSIELLAPERSFVHRPSSVAAPFGLSAPAPMDLGAVAQRFGARLRRGALERVDVGRRVAVAAGGGNLFYDHLVIAVGAVPHPAVSGALTFAGPREAPALEALLTRIERGAARRVAFALPAGATWSLPLYELAVMAATDLRSRGVSGAELTVVTPEPAPLWLFGPAAGPAVRNLLAARGIDLRTSTHAVALSGGQLEMANREPLPVDAAVALPTLRGPGLAGLPEDGQGFLPIDAHGRVPGAPAVYAAGDATTFPVKQGGLATQQADAVAEAIAAEVGAIRHAAPFHPVLRGLLLTGGAPLYLRAELSGARGAATTRALRGEISGRALWWPPGKVAGRYLAPYLADARPVDLASEPLRDRTPGAAGAAPDHEEAFQLALLLAEEDAKVGDYRQALHALDAAAALSGGVLPEAWAENRSRWERELARTG
jgi:sulfide:quinone oxidoreductase